MLNTEGEAHTGVYEILNNVVGTFLAGKGLHIGTDFYFAYPLPINTFIYYSMGSDQIERLSLTHSYNKYVGKK